MILCGGLGSKRQLAKQSTPMTVLESVTYKQHDRCQVHSSNRKHYYQHYKRNTDSGMHGHHYQLEKCYVVDMLHAARSGYIFFH